MTGKVVDAASGEPIEDAMIQITNRGDSHGDLSAGATARTGAGGEFRLRPRYNLHIVYYANASWDMSLPLGSHWTGGVQVTHPGYRPLYFSAVDDTREHKAPVIVGELRLVPLIPAR